MRHVVLATTVLIASVSGQGQRCTAPGPAAAVGYNTQTLGGVALGKNWFACRRDAATQNADGSITIPGGTCNHYNGQLTTGDQQFGGGGYFEATLSFKNPPAGWSKSVDGWPAFWGIPKSAAGLHVEADFFEFMTAGDKNKFEFGLQTWPDNDPSHIIWAGDGGYGLPTSAYLPQNFDPAQPHTYGFLWVPASAGKQGSGKMFVDNQQVGPIYSWSPGGRFSSIDQNKLQIILGTGSANPMTVYDVQVWQGPGANNLGDPHPTGGSCTRAKG